MFRTIVGLQHLGTSSWVIFKYFISLPSSQLSTTKWFSYSEDTMDCTTYTLMICTALIQWRTFGISLRPVEHRLKRADDNRALWLEKKCIYSEEPRKCDLATDFYLWFMVWLGTRLSGMREEKIMSEKSRKWKWSGDIESKIVFPVTNQLTKLFSWSISALMERKVTITSFTFSVAKFGEKELFMFLRSFI